MRNNSTKIQKVWTWTQIKRPVKLRIAHYGSIWNMDARKEAVTHTYASVFSRNLGGQHRCTPGEIDALAEAYIHAAEDGLALHVAFPSLYEHVGNRDVRLQTRDTAAATAAAATATSNSN